MNAPETPDLSEFESATPIQKFHRFLVTTDGQVTFGLLGENGKNNYFTASPEIMGGVALEFLNLAAAGQRTKAGDANKSVEMPFPTSAVFTLIPKGNGTNGSIEFRFLTPENMIFTTLIGPQLGAELASSLLHVLSTMPNPPPIFEMAGLHSKLPGKQHQGNNTSVHFGQRYQSKILNVLGLLVIRANLLESAMVRLLSALLELPAERTEAIFYSSQNMKARSDMLRATTATAGLTETQVGRVLKDIEAIDRISRRRNQLIHGEWRFSGEKFSVKERKPLANTKSQDAIETFKSIESIVTDFHDTTVMLDLTTKDIINSRSVAKMKV